MDRFDADVIIVGGGITGGVLALLLAQEGIRCTVIDERNPETDTANPAVSNRALAITVASARILLYAGCWSRLPPERTGLFREIHVWDEQGIGEVRFDCHDICEPVLGYIVEQALLQDALWDAMGQMRNVTLIQGVSVTAIEYPDGGISVRLSNGKTTGAKLLAAADGAHSRTRQLAGIDYKIHDYHQQAVTCVVNTELPHGNIARQRFLQKGPLAFLPMADPDSCGVVWSTTPDHAEELMGLTAEGFHDAVQRAFESRLGRINDSGVRASFPLKRAQALHYCKPRLVLVGDAAHCVHPMAGQGANLGILDAASLAEVMSEAAASKRDIASSRVLRRYQRWRKGESLQMMMVLDGLKGLFESHSRLISGIRGAGMRTVDSLPVIKHLIMRRAMGLEGDLPAIARTQL